jgi:hypothetical protein
MLVKVRSAVTVIIGDLLLTFYSSPKMEKVSNAALWLYCCEPPDGTQNPELAGGTLST